MGIPNKAKLSITMAVAASALSLGLVAPSVSGAAVKAHLTGNIRIAEGPQAQPTFILPFVGPGDGFSVTNMNQFQMLMYRPLFWFGAPGSAAFVPALSLGTISPATGSSATYTIKLKGWKFANGQTINAGNVEFFLNLYKAIASLPHGDPMKGDIYAGYVPDVGVPDGIASVAGTPSGDTVTITMKSAVNANWLLYNYLSEITPFASSWDKTSDGGADGSGNCESDTFGSAQAQTDCKAVLTYLRTTAAVPSAWTNTLWQGGVDGPWKLQSADQKGNIVFVPNPTYGGPQKAQVAKVTLVPFTSSAAELIALKGNQLDEGYVDPTQLTQPAPSPGVAGPNLPALSANYNLLGGASWSFNYDLYNLGGTNNGSKELGQLYIRQAMQEATDQDTTIKVALKGYGVPTYSPLPFGAPASISDTVDNPYPYNPKAALAAFKAHGWVLNGGVQQCVNPGTGANQCGGTIPKNARMNLVMDQAAGSAADDELTSVEVSQWQSIGINVTVNQDTFGNVLSLCQGPNKGFDLCDWGGGWLYAPDYYPSGEELFATGAGSNTGNYSDAKMDQLITASTVGSATLTAFERYAAAQLPVFFKPTGTGAGEVSKKLKSVNGFKSNPLENLMPEYLSF
jgi:peptide/nickel transport system substrate-binding protein